MSDVSTVPEARLQAALGADARGCLAQMVAEIETHPSRVRVHMPAAARLIGRGPLGDGDPRGILGPTLDDAVRAELLMALHRATEDRTDVRAEEVRDLYRFGDADEKRAVLRALHRLDVGAGAVPLLRDALRTNDIRLVAAALGPYAAEHLDADAWRQGVLKCLFVGVPLQAVAGLADRTDAELVRMVAAYAEERRAAARDVPGDALTLLDASAPDSEEN